MPLRVGQVLNQRYRVDALLGQGGMGAVYLAWDLNLEIPVAVKENLDASAEAQRQFGREANILAHLAHPSLPRVTDYFSVPNQGQYLVMDYIEGQDLQTMLDQRGALPEAQVLAWIEQVCGALAYLHSQPFPIIHRDIKPANIKIRPDGQAMLVDFGIAKAYDPQLATTMGAKAVTPGYSPPEQYGGAGSTDARSDVYALGATLYHLLTGQKPPESVQRVVESLSVTPPRQLNGQLSPAVEQAVLRAMELTTNRRFQNVKDLVAALHGRPIAEPALTPTVLLPGRPARPPAAPTELLQPAPALRSRGWLWALLGVVGVIVVVVAVARLARSPAGETPYPGREPTPFQGGSALPGPTYTPYPTYTPPPADTPYPTYTPLPVDTSAPTRTPLPAATSAPLPTVHPAVARPALRSRSTWGAAAPSGSYLSQVPVHITIHHEGVYFDKYTDDETAAKIRGVQKFCMGRSATEDIGGQPWVDITYHYIVDLRGNIYEGRPPDRRANSSSYDCTGHIIIGVLGDYNRQSPSEAQISALVHLAAWLAQEYDIPTSQIRGHRDYVDTTSPGANLFSQMDRIRREVQQELGQ